MEVSVRHLRSELAQAESDIFTCIEQAAKRLRSNTGATISNIEISFKNVAPPDAQYEEYCISDVVVNVNIR